MRNYFKISALALSLFASTVYSAPYQCDQIIHKTGFDICYNFKLKAALWSKATLTASNLKKERFSRKGIRFFEEKSLPSGKRASLSMYRNSGYDRGHKISNADQSFSRKNQIETFSLANITPQVPSLNRGLYSKAEKATRRLIIRSNDRGLIVAGAIYDRINPKRLRHGGVAIPKEIYRIVKIRNGNTYAYLFPNQKEFSYGKNLKKYRVKVSEIEKKTGFKF